MYRRKTLTGSPDPTHATGRIKPCIIGGEPGHVGSVHRSQDTEEAKKKLIRPGKETRQVLVQTIVKVKYLVRE